MKTKLFSLITLAACLRLVGSPQESEDFIAHEWGTFTSVQGADGVQIRWNPFLRTDLPEFVYSRNVRKGGFGGSFRLVDFSGKGTLSSFVRMETPVIYLYCDRERTADVLVNLENGLITEWYPQATRVGPYDTSDKAEAAQAKRSFIEWKGVKVLPRDTKEISGEKLIREKGGNHYYSARETDANFLRMESPHARTSIEYERDLFYRGILWSQAPLTLTLDGDENQLRLSTKEPLTDLFVLTIRNGMARYQYVERVTSNESRAVKLDSKPFAPLSDVQASIMTDMKAALVKQGLYLKEAQAMVDTWKDQWFTEQGVRVLHLLSRDWTDRTLPLTINPQPNSIARVMVGRAELITPSTEWGLKREIVRYSTGTDAAKQQAVAQVRKLGIGRFLEPATRKVLGKTPDKEFSNAAWSLAQEVSKIDESKQPAVVEKQTRPNLVATSNLETF